MTATVLKWTGAILLAASATAVGFLLLRKKKANDTEAVFSTIAEGIKQNASEFDGLYEGLYQAARNKQEFSTDAYVEWCERVEQMENEKFRSAYASRFTKADIGNEQACREKYEQLLHCVELAGIKRDRESGAVCVADDIMCRAYVEASGQKPEAGTQYTVIKTAWLSGQQVIEYGMILYGTLNIAVSGEEEQ